VYLLIWLSFRLVDVGVSIEVYPVVIHLRKYIYDVMNCGEDFVGCEDVANSLQTILEMLC